MPTQRVEKLVVFTGAADGGLVAVQMTLVFATVQSCNLFQFCELRTRRGTDDGSARDADETG